jgi:hypothetical protein
MNCTENSCAGDDGRNRLVEDALLKIATGYTVEEEQIEAVIDPETGAIQNNFKRKTIRSAIPGNLRAQIFWLTNCSEGKWKEHPEKFFQSGDNEPGENMNFSETEMNL